MVIAASHSGNLQREWNTFHREEDVGGVSGRKGRGRNEEVGGREGGRGEEIVVSVCVNRKLGPVNGV